MMNAYSEMYLGKAMINLGDAVDYAVNKKGLDGTEFTMLFSRSTAGRRFENGEASYLIGKSGIDIFADVIAETKGEIPKVESYEDFGRSPEFWIGWALCYYQWIACLSFKAILRMISYEELRNLYEPLHEADISKFVDLLNERRLSHSCETNLKRIRHSNGYSQSELSRKSGVSLRSIQMYEQLNKDINKCAAETICSLARTLNCDPEDLLE